jgi:hypothetical protein
MPYFLTGSLTEALAGFFVCPLKPSDVKASDERATWFLQERGMKSMKCSFALIGALTLAVCLTTGCEVFSPEDGGTGQPAEISEYGGFTTSDETPAFGDSDLLGHYPEDRPFADDMENDPEVGTGQNDRRAVQYAVRVVWGNIERRDSSLAAACPISEWSGMLEVDGGVAIVKRLILFDPGDSIVRPRRSPRSVQWISYTRDHVDGILLKIIDLPDPSGRESTNTLTITTPFYSREIPFAELEDYREFVVYDGCNAISIVATRIEPLACPKGFLEGRWISATDTSGYFKGAWIGQYGTLMGHLRGVYEIRDGERVLFGKWINRSGEFQGLLRGTWTPIETDGGPDGLFEGRWADDQYEVKGFFRGQYCVCGGDTTGAFHGRWIKDCR